MIWLKRLVFILLVFCVLAYTILFSLRNHSQIDIDLVFILLPDVQVEFALVWSFVFGAFFWLIGTDLGVASTILYELFANINTPRT